MVFYFLDNLWTEWGTRLSKTISGVVEKSLTTSPTTGTTEREMTIPKFTHTNKFNSLKLKP